VKLTASWLGNYIDLFDDNNNVEINYEADNFLYTGAEFNLRANNSSFY